MTGAPIRPWVAVNPGGTRGATLLEYAALLGGESQMLPPTCVHPLLGKGAAHAALVLDDDSRQGLLGLLGGLVDTAPTGTGAEQRVLNVRLACWAAQQVLPAVEPAWQSVCREALDAALGWCDGVVAVDLVTTDALETSSVTAANVPWAARAAFRAVRTVGTEFMIGENGRSSGGLAVQSAVLATPLDAVPAFLTALIGEYDRLVGREQWRAVSEQDLASLAVLAALGS